MTSEHLEIEQKFDVADSFVVPNLATVPGVAEVEGPQEHHLVAVYYDTFDLSLLRAKVTLRRRTGGTDEGWHVKMPAGYGARREMQIGLGPSGEPVPGAVLDLVQDVSEGAEISPVAVLRTTRRVRPLWSRSGDQLAEVADDTVSATAYAARPGAPATVTTWREVEVELFDGDEQLLAAVASRLLEAGATASASSSKLGRVLEDRLADLTGLPPASVESAPTQAPEKPAKKAPKAKAEKAEKPAKPQKAAKDAKSIKEKKPAKAKAEKNPKPKAKSAKAKGK